MKHSVAHHLAEHTYLYEFQTSVCDSTARSTPNFHKNLELIVALEGECNLHIHDRSYRICKGQAALIMPYHIHSFDVAPGGSVICTNFGEVLAPTLYKVINKNRPVTPVFTPTAETYGYFCGQMLSLFGRGYAPTQMITPLPKRIKVKGLLYSIESEFLEQVPLKAVNDFETITEAVLKYISENFKENITLKDIATNTGYNYQYLSRSFNDMLCSNFKTLLNHYRIEHAYALLYGTDNPITDIALDSGFQSLRSFYRVCTKVFGCSPKELRERARSV